LIDVVQVIFALYRSMYWNLPITLRPEDQRVLLREVERLRACEMRLKEMVKEKVDDDRPG
jgi:hypothetical protein